ncbi:dhh family [Fusarium subglutinans]|uniref:Dhh family n=1 Tax=Gibberella subglutinans TaxID=42677 RepID=A0A8H5V4T9_GIBSU|nr:dhh family [Fusarium subglutinans]KAF5609288.1 dhh family [Fusarium subglutinans]
MVRQFQRSIVAQKKFQYRGEKPMSSEEDYHKAQPRKDQAGNVMWPAPKSQIEKAKDFIRECAAAGKQTLIVPDKDADGLAAGAIIRKTLMLLGLDSKLISCYTMNKNSLLHYMDSRTNMEAYKPSYIIVLDQGSGKSEPVIDSPHRALVIDHHLAEDDDHPEGAILVTANKCPPIATSSLLTYLICRDLHQGVEEACGWLCVMGTHGDLGNAIRWRSPFPNMQATFETHTKKTIDNSVKLINAPRRTAQYDVPRAWKILIKASSPMELVKNRFLKEARAEVILEMKKAGRVVPKFSADKKIAVIRINSKAQIHAVIAARQARQLFSRELEVVMVANEGYARGVVNYSCRVPTCARGRDPPVNIPEILIRAAEGADDDTLIERLGPRFAGGHKNASGGMIPQAEFEEFLEVIGVSGDGKPSPSPKKSPKGCANQDQFSIRS